VDSHTVPPPRDRRVGPPGRIELPPRPPRPDWDTLIALLAAHEPVVLDTPGGRVIGLLVEGIEPMMLVLNRPPPTWADGTPVALWVPGGLVVAKSRYVPAVKWMLVRSFCGGPSGDRSTWASRTAMARRLGRTGPTAAKDLGRDLTELVKLEYARITACYRADRDDHLQVASITTLADTPGEFLEPPEVVARRYADHTGMTLFVGRVGGPVVTPTTGKRPGESAPAQSAPPPEHNARQVGAQSAGAIPFPTGDLTPTTGGSAVSRTNESDEATPTPPPPRRRASARQLELISELEQELGLDSEPPRPGALPSARDAHARIDELLGLKRRGNGRVTTGQARDERTRQILADFVAGENGRDPDPGLGQIGPGGDL
jgi:hypothetical protein